MEKVYFLEETYDDWLSNTCVIDSGTEGTVLAFGDEVIKILHSNLDMFTKYRLRRLSEIDGINGFITAPTKEIYYDYRFIGFAMKYAGINLRDFLISKINCNNLTLDNKIFYLSCIRDCILRLRRFGIIHGDIQPRNILVDSSNKVLLGDINNCTFSIFKNPYLNEISLRLYEKYGLSYLIDLHTFNYFTYLIMNLDGDELIDVLNLGADIIWSYDITKLDNKYFDSDVLDVQMDLMLEKNNKKKALKYSDYLINHLK